MDNSENKKLDKKLKTKELNPDANLEHDFYYNNKMKRLFDLKDNIVNLSKIKESLFNTLLRERRK